MGRTRLRWFAGLMGLVVLASACETGTGTEPTPSTGFQSDATLADYAAFAAALAGPRSPLP